MTQLLSKKASESGTWIHIPQSFCGRISFAPTNAHIAGICTFGFSTCNIVVITYKTQNEILKSLIHFDSWNHPEYMITDEVKYYQNKYPNGICKIYIIKRKHQSVVTDKIKSASIFTDKTVAYEIISISNSSKVTGIGIRNNSKTVDKQSILQIKQEQYKRIVSDLNVSSTSDFNLIRHPNEWKLVLERKVIARIANIDAQNTWANSIIFNGHFWMNINRGKIVNKDYKKIYQSLKHFLDLFTFDTPMGDILQSLHSIFKKNILCAATKGFVTDSSDKYAVTDYILVGAVCTKILKGFQKYKNKNFVLTKIIHENCQALIDTLQSNGNVEYMNMAIETDKISIDEKISVIACCKNMIKIKNIEKMNRSKILEICRNYNHDLCLNILFGSQFDCYMNDKKRKLLVNESEEYSTVALQNYQKQEFTTAKKIYYQVLIYAQYLYYSPSHNVAKAYYNYGASCQNAGDIERASVWLDIANTINKEIPESKFDKQKNERKNKIAKRLKYMGKDIENI